MNDTAARWLTGAALSVLFLACFALLCWAIHPAPPMLKTNLDLGCQTDGL